MTATDELRKLLDDRGVEHEDKHTELVPDISDWDSTWWQGIAGMTFLAIEDKTCGREGCVYINGTHLTPEQAIVATLGRGACRSTTPDDAWCFACSECGKSFPRDELHLAHNHGEINYCPNCGRKVKR